MTLKPTATTQHLILASASASRARLLRNAGVPFTIKISEVDEDHVKRGIENPGRAAARIAQKLADAKALAVSAENPDALVIGADQTLALGDHLINKASRRADAIATLSLLSGKTHILPTALSVATKGAVIWRWLEVPELTLRPLDVAAIENYLDQAGDGVYGCVGCYMIEGIGLQLFDKLEGDLFTIQGLPLLPLLAYLRSQGIESF